MRTYLQQCAISSINFEISDIRLELCENHNEETLKKIIEKYVTIGNFIITDAWHGYNFLNLVDSGFIHHAYNYIHGNFG